MAPLSLEAVDAQEQVFAAAFASGDITGAAGLYHPEVVYVSPTTRLFGRPPVIEGVEATLEFIQLTISGCRNIGYRLDERALIAGSDSAYARIHFDWDAGPRRHRSTYVVVYRYSQGLISRQELYYDPDGPFEEPATG